MRITDDEHSLPVSITMYKLMLILICGALVMYTVNAFLFRDSKKDEVNKQDNLLNASSLEEITLDFKEIDTSEKEYKEIEQKMSKFVNKMYKEGDIVKSNLVTTYNIPEEEVYIDNLDMKENKKIALNLVLDDSIYLQDMVVQKYINEEGLMVTLIGIKDDSDEIIVTDTANFQDKRDIMKHYELSYDDKNNTLDGIEYTDMIRRVLLYIYSPGSPIDYNSANDIMKFVMTDDLREECTNIIKNMNTDITSMCTIQTIDYGKSDIKKSYIDRVIAKLNIQTDGKEYPMLLEIKLNKSGRVYNISVI